MRESVVYILLVVISFSGGVKGTSLPSVESSIRPRYLNTDADEEVVNSTLVQSTSPVFGAGDEASVDSKFEDSGGDVADKSLTRQILTGDRYSSVVDSSSSEPSTDVENRSGSEMRAVPHVSGHYQTEKRDSGNSVPFIQGVPSSNHPTRSYPIQISSNSSSSSTNNEINSKQHQVSDIPSNATSQTSALFGNVRTGINVWGGQRGHRGSGLGFGGNRRPGFIGGGHFGGHRGGGFGGGGHSIVFGGHRRPIWSLLGGLFPYGYPRHQEGQCWCGGPSVWGTGVRGHGLGGAGTIVHGVWGYGHGGTGNIGHGHRSTGNRWYGHVGTGHKGYGHGLAGDRGSGHGGSGNRGYGHGLTGDRGHGGPGNRGYGHGLTEDKGYGGTENKGYGHGLTGDRGHGGRGNRGYGHGLTRDRGLGGHGQDRPGGAEHSIYGFGEGGHGEGSYERETGKRGIGWTGLRGIGVGYRRGEAGTEGDYHVEHRRGRDHEGGHIQRDTHDKNVAQSYGK